MKVLIVDDEPLVRRAICRAAQRRGHEVEEAEDGRKGLEKWLTFKPDLVYLDVLMPELNGPQVLEEMAGKNQAKVILMSAYSGKYDVEKAQCIGASLFLEKPFDDIFKVIEMGEGLVNG